ncbi:hypothetical protein [Streptomyces sp. NPDC058371]|uniref:hypothetical protein n=1 Tax=Streptomyces sp. NPDC058371 TaxID=3346463 RepID=UPI0036606CE8
MTNTRILLASAALAVGGLALTALPATADSPAPAPAGQLGQLGQLNPLSQATGALNPVFGLLAPVTSTLPL